MEAAIALIIIGIVVFIFINQRKSGSDNGTNGNGTSGSGGANGGNGNGGNTTSFSVCQDSSEMMKKTIKLQDTSRLLSSSASAMRNYVVESE